MFICSVIILFIGSLLIARDHSGYDNRYNDRKYFTLNNKQIAKILLPKTVGFLRGHPKRSKSDFNKMTYAGAILYVGILILALLLPVVLYIVPEVCIDPLLFRSSTPFYVNTINEHIVLFSLLWFICFELLVVCLGYIGISRKKQQKGAMVWLLLALLLQLFGLVCFTWELVSAIIILVS